MNNGDCFQLDPNVFYITHMHIGGQVNTLTLLSNKFGS